MTEQSQEQQTEQRSAGERTVEAVEENSRRDASPAIESEDTKNTSTEAVKEGAERREPAAEVNNEAGGVAVQLQAAEEKQPPKSRKESAFLTSAKPTETLSVEESEADLFTSKAQVSQLDELLKDKSIFSAFCKLYFLSPSTKKLETRGDGTIAILKDDSELYKVLMIREKLMLKGCNHYIALSCPLSKASQVPRSWVWMALDDKSDAEKNFPKTTYFVTFKTEEESAEFAKAYNKAQAANSETLKRLRATSE